MIGPLTFGALWLSLTLRDIFLPLTVFAQTGGSCKVKEGTFFGLPTWYKYLEGQKEEGGGCVPKITELNDVWAIVLAIVEILLRIAAIAAVVYVLYGGIRFITAQGNSEKITAARTAVQDALIGLLIAVVAIAVVSFIGNQFK